jgi:hypothetical protein
MWESVLHYFKVFPNPVGKGIKPQEKVQFSPQHDIKTASTEEVSAVIRKLKNNRTLGEDSVRHIVK